MSEALLNLLVSVSWVIAGCSSAMTDGQDVGVLLRNTVDSARLMSHLGSNLHSYQAAKESSARAVRRKNLHFL